MKYEPEYFQKYDAVCSVFEANLLKDVLHQDKISVNSISNILHYSVHLTFQICLIHLVFEILILVNTGPTRV